jgi:hypothetical protein
MPNLTHKQFSSQGGKNSAAKLTTAQRAERARLGAAKREMSRFSKRELETLRTALNWFTLELDTPITDAHHMTLQARAQALRDKITQSLSKLN